MGQDRSLFFYLSGVVHLHVQKKTDKISDQGTVNNFKMEVLIVGNRFLMRLERITIWEDD